MSRGGRRGYASNAAEDEGESCGRCRRGRTQFPVLPTISAAATKPRAEAGEEEEVGRSCTYSGRAGPVMVGDVKQDHLGVGAVQLQLQPGEVSSEDDIFDQDAGFLVQDTVVFSAEVLILKETATMQELSDEDSKIGSSSSGCQIDTSPKHPSFTWKVENFLSFKEIMETRKNFSKYFQAGGCELRIGVYESFDTICIYLESDQPSGVDPDKNFWVHYKMAILDQKNSLKTVCKESSIWTKTWNDSVLQFMKVSDILDTEAGFLVRDTVIFVCEIIDCCPWFDFSDLENNPRKQYY